MKQLALVGLIALATATLAGCQGSRWARQDPIYSKKYSRHTDDPVRTIKQSIDARQVAGRDGNYFSTAFGSNPNVGELSVGKFLYLPHLKGMVESRIGLKGLVSLDNDGGGAGGLEAGVRVQSPSRLAPFAGISAFGGLGPSDYLEAFLSTSDQSDDDTQGAIGISPEVGVHYWITPQWRLTTSVSQNYYRFEEADHSIDYTTVGMSLSYLNIPYYREKRRSVQNNTTCTDSILATPFPGTINQSGSATELLSAPGEPLNGAYSDLFRNDATYRDGATK